MPTRVTVAEGKHRRLTTGIGYGSEEKARATLRWDHLNFFGNARHAGVETQVVVARSRRAPRLHRAVLPQLALLAELRGTRLAGGRTGLLAELAGRPRDAPPPGQLAELLGCLAHQRVPAQQHQQRRSRGLLNPQQPDCPRTGSADRHRRAARPAAVAFDINRNTTNNLLDANRGYVLSGHVEQAGKWLWGTYNYWEVHGEARHYTRVARSFVWANRLHLGTIDALGGSSNVPFFKRYFLGGATSIRGWGRFEVSPLSGFGLPIGGLSMLEGSTEIRKPLFGKLGAVGFFDFGNVSDRVAASSQRTVCCMPPGPACDI